uniref:EGF-like domain-containing protein n=1 Tax=Mola mola TaxID=94237 RepID=A0A3Q4A914_MOLML
SLHNETCPSHLQSALSSVDVDECSFEGQCHRELGNTCVNTPGSFVCQCQPGFRAEAPACVGKAAVDSKIRVCFSQITCFSGVFAIGRHIENFCMWPSSLLVSDPDVDECVERPAVCDGPVVCENTMGSYKCVCPPGYRGNGSHCEGKLLVPPPIKNDPEWNNVQCVCTPFPDENECATGGHGCDSKARCGNIIGSYFCQCYQGFNGDGRSCFGGCFQQWCSLLAVLVSVLACANSTRAHSAHPVGIALIADIDECAVNNGHCAHNCSNESGGYSCQCATGYQLDQDGHNCTAVCNPPCHNYGVCVGPNSCDCPPGYPGLGCSGSH